MLVGYPLVQRGRNQGGQSGVGLLPYACDQPTDRLTRPTRKARSEPRPDLHAVHEANMDCEYITNFLHNMIFSSRSRQAVLRCHIPSTADTLRDWGTPLTLAGLIRGLHR